MGLQRPAVVGVSKKIEAEKNPFAPHLSRQGWYLAVCMDGIFLFPRRPRNSLCLREPTNSQFHARMMKTEVA